MRARVNRGLPAVLSLLLAALAWSGSAAADELRSDHPVRGMPWLAERLLLAEVPLDDAAAGALAAEELGILLAHGEAEAAMVRLVELEALFGEPQLVDARRALEAQGEAWTSPTVTWTAEPAATEPGDVELILLWGGAFPKSSGRDPTAVVTSYDRFGASGLRIHALVPDDEVGADHALRLLGALNRPVGIGLAPPELWTAFGGGRTTLALLVRDGRIAWRGYPSQLPMGSLRSWLDEAHRATHRKPARAFDALVDAELGCATWRSTPLLRRAGLAHDGEAAGEVSLLRVEGCGHTRLVVRLDEQTWLSGGVRRAEGP